MRIYICTICAENCAVIHVNPFHLPYINLTVEEVMRYDPICIEPTATIQEGS